MSERLSDVTARIGSVRQLSAVISAMRGIAAVHSREARDRLDGIRAYARTIATAIGEALAFLPQAGRTAAGGGASGGHAVIALCAEQGFAGVFSERVLDEAVALIGRAPGGSSRGAGADLLVVGDRGLLVADERGLAVSWSAPMAAHAGQATALADRIIGELYRRLEEGEATRISVVHAVPGPTAGIHVVTRTLVPFDYGRFPPASGASGPLITLPPETLLARLAEEYIFAELCEAVTLSFAAENEARMRAMIAARSSVADTLETLVGRSRQLRQEQITDEIVELSVAVGRRG